MSITVERAYAQSSYFCGFESKTHSITGKLSHTNGDPVTHQKVQVYAEMWFMNFYFGEWETNEKGELKVGIRWSWLPFSKQTNIIFKVFEETLPGKNFFGKVVTGKREVDHFKAPLMRNSHSLDIRNRKVNLYEYQSGFPDLQQPEQYARRPQQWAITYYFHLIRAAIDERLKSFLLNFWGAPTVAGVQNLFGVDNPELTLDSETTSELLLNGLYPCNFLKGEEEDALVVDINWDRYELDESPQLPNVKLTLEKDGELLDAKEVVVKFRDQDAKVYRFGDEGFERALFLFNSAAIVKGEVVSHLGMGHIWSGQAAMALFRTVNKNPIKALLAPHLREVLEINRMGVSDIFGPEGILNVSGLKAGSIIDSLKDVLGGMCYSNFKPRAPVNENHRFAKAENVYWDLLCGVVDRFFNENQEEIEKRWYEIYYMSKSLVEHSLPHRPWEGQADMSAWDDSSEIDDPNFPGRVTINGDVRAVRPITLSKDKPLEGDMERLKQFCRHAIFMVTFWHWAVHSTQGKWGTNLSIASLAPENNGEGDFGGTSVKNARRQLEVAHVLADFDGGAMLKNPHGDIYQPLLDAIKENKGLFAALGYDIRKLTYGTII